MVIVYKNNGSLRVCLDSRAINTAIERERCPIPTIDDLIVEMNGACIFSKFDCNKGYHQLELKPECRYITTFSTHQGVFQYKRLCFGINSAAETFQKHIEGILRGIPGVRNISDDIIVGSKTEEEHAKTLREVFIRL